MSSTAARMMANAEVLEACGAWEGEAGNDAAGAADGEVEQDNLYATVADASQECASAIGTTTIGYLHQSTTSDIQRWEVDSGEALRALKAGLAVDQCAVARYRHQRKARAKPSPTAAAGGARAGESLSDGLARRSAPVRIPGLRHPVILATSVEAEAAFLASRFAELHAVAGVQPGEDIIAEAQLLHRRVTLLDEAWCEELGRRLDATIAALKRRHANRDTITRAAELTPKEMEATVALSRVVDDCHDHHLPALEVVRRLHGLRPLIQEAFQRASALAVLQQRTRATQEFLATAPLETEEIRLATKDVGAAVTESLTAFRQRLAALKKN